MESEKYIPADSVTVEIDRVEQENVNLSTGGNGFTIPESATAIIAIDVSRPRNNEPVKVGLQELLQELIAWSLEKACNWGTLPKDVCFVVVFLWTISILKCVVPHE